MENFDPKKSYYDIEVTRREITDYKKFKGDCHPDARAITSSIFTQKVNEINLKRIIGAINAPPDWAIQPPQIIRDVDLTELRKMPPGEIEKS